MRDCRMQVCWLPDWARRKAAIGHPSERAVTMRSVTAIRLRELVVGCMCRIFLHFSSAEHVRVCGRTSKVLLYNEITFLARLVLYSLLRPIKSVASYQVARTWSFGGCALRTVVS